jgi:hypothetical protein
MGEREGHSIAIEPLVIDERYFNDFETDSNNI